MPSRMDVFMLMLASFLLGIYASSPPGPWPWLDMALLFWCLFHVAVWSLIMVGTYIRGRVIRYRRKKAVARLYWHHGKERWLQFHWERWDNMIVPAFPQEHP